MGMRRDIHFVFSIVHMVHKLDVYVSQLRMSKFDLKWDTTCNICSSSVSAVSEIAQ